ncbi:MAG TPA: [LysW]-lysine hydrolase [Candidatus Saccharimonadales bacterium]|nr:[LysW]-lysine hydrolase [Candidatus Saccharimonadales bacterium]
MSADLSERDVALLGGLVAIPSVSRNEADAVEWLVARMAERGFRASVDPAGNAVGEIGEGPVHVVLLGHIDTVPGDIPVRIEAGELVGRGAVDAKGPLAAFVAAATLPPAGVRITVVGAVEEESPTSKGARYRATLPAPDWCVIGEPSGWDGVTVGYKGRLILGLSLSREARHGAAPGPTCAEEALALWTTIVAAAEARTPAARGFLHLDCRLEGIQARAGDGLTERAELRVGYRIPPGIPVAQLVSEMRDLAEEHRGDAEVTVDTVATEEPARTPRSTTLARAFAGAIAGAGGQAAFRVKSGTSDMNVLLPAWGSPMVAYGPGDARYDHTPMERLGLADYGRAIVVLRGVLERAAKQVR